MYARVEHDYLDSLRAMADADLVRRAKLGNDVALSVLLARHSEALLRFCRHLAWSPEDAEDIFQETMVRAIARVDSVQTGSSFRSWLFRIAKNLSVDTFRSRKRTCPLPDEEITPLPIHEDGPHDSVETGEEHQTVAQALNRLAESHQRVLVLREVEGLSYAAIARELNVSQSAVETLLFRARRRLREEYIKRVAAVPAVAAISALRDLVARIAGPLIGGPPLVKVAVTAALVGTVAVSTPELLPRHPAPLIHVPAPRIHVHAAAHHTKAHILVASRVHTRLHRTISRRHTRFRHVAALRRVGRHKVHRAMARSSWVAVRRLHRMHTVSRKRTRRMRTAKSASPPRPPPVPHIAARGSKPAGSSSGSTASASLQPPPPPGSAPNQTAAPTTDTAAVHTSGVHATSTGGLSAQPVSGADGPTSRSATGNVTSLAAPGQIPTRGVGPAQPTSIQSVASGRAAELVPDGTDAAPSGQRAGQVQSPGTSPVSSAPPQPAAPQAPSGETNGSGTSQQPGVGAVGQGSWNSQPSGATVLGQHP